MGHENLLRRFRLVDHYCPKAQSVPFSKCFLGINIFKAYGSTLTKIHFIHV